MFLLTRSECSLKWEIIQNIIAWVFHDSHSLVNRYICFNFLVVGVNTQAEFSQSIWILSSLYTDYQIVTAKLNTTGRPRTVERLHIFK